MSFQDSFTAASDENLEDHTPDVGTGWTLTGTPGAALVFSSFDALRSATSTPSYYICDDQGSADHAVSFRNKVFSASPPSSSFVCVRLVDASNFIGWRIVGTGSAGRRLSKSVGGTITDLITSQGVDEEWIKVEVSGTTVKLFEGGTGGSPSWTQVGADQTVSDFSTETSQGIRIGSAVSLDWIDDFEAWALGGGATTLTIADATHAHSADSLTLTSDHLLSVADALHAHAADALALSSDAFLAVDDSVHAHGADNLTIDTSGSASLVVAGAGHGHTSDELGLSVDAFLAVADSTHAHVAGNLVLTSDHLLSVADALHAHLADNLTLSDSPSLAVDDASHAHAADGLALTLDSTLGIAGVLHGHLAGNVDLIYGASLEISGSLHAHYADGLVLALPVFDGSWPAPGAGTFAWPSGSAGLSWPAPSGGGVAWP